MLTRIRKSMEERDQGFTLIELLVVIIIIGILAAIAIPVFLNQRQKAFDSQAKSDLRNLASQMESAFVDANAYPAAAPTGARISSGTHITVKYDDTAKRTKWCAFAYNDNGSADSAATSGKTTYVYDNDNGGMRPAGTKTCSVSATGFDLPVPAP